MLVVLFIGVASACVPSQALGARVDGISDQLLSRSYAAGAEEQPLAGLVRPVATDALPAGPIRYARFVVAWDVMGVPAGEALRFELFRAWLEDVREEGLIPDVAIEQAETTVVSNGAALPRVPGSQGQYERYVRALLDYAASIGEPIAYLEAWNEPNGTGKGPVGVGHPSARAAAGFMNAATWLCVTHACVAIAGDFADDQYRFAGHPEVKEGGTGMGAGYEREYERYLDPPAPVNWAIHPYAAVKYQTRETLASFIAGLPRAPAAIWFTEVGVYECQAGKQSGAGLGRGEQQGGAMYLDALTETVRDLAHVFYYEPTAPSRAQEARCPDGEDTSLYNYRDEPRPTASLVFGEGVVPPFASAIFY